MRVCCFLLIALCCFVRPLAADIAGTLASKAETQARAGDSAGALNLLAQASQAKPISAESEDEIGFLYTALGKSDEGIQHFRRAIAKNPSLAAAHYHLGVILWLGGVHVAATSELADAVRLAPDVFDYRFRLGAAYVEAGNYDDAVPVLQKATEFNSKSAEAWNSLGQALQGKHDLEPAVDAYKKAVDLQPANDQFRVAYAASLTETRQADRAIAELRQILAHAPKDEFALVSLGYAQLKKGSFDEAAREFRTVLAANPNSVAAHYDLGIALKMKDQIEAAQKEFAEVIRLDPEMPEARYTLGHHGLADW